MSGTLNLKKIKLGDNADLSKNFVISVPAVADGTLVIERGNGTDVLTMDASGKVVFPGNSQAWTNPTRVAGTTYTNNEVVNITVSVVVYNTAASGYYTLDLFVDGSVVQRVSQSTTGTGVYASVSAQVPPGATYQVNLTGTNNPTVSAWKELR